MTLARSRAQVLDEMRPRAMGLKVLRQSSEQENEEVFLMAYLMPFRRHGFWVTQTQPSSFAC